MQIQMVITSSGVVSVVNGQGFVLSFKIENDHKSPFKKLILSNAFKNATVLETPLILTEEINDTDRFVENVSLQI